MDGASARLKSQSSSRRQTPFLCPPHAPPPQPTAAAEAFQNIKKKQNKQTVPPSLHPHPTLLSFIILELSSGSDTLEFLRVQPTSE